MFFFLFRGLASGIFNAHILPTGQFQNRQPHRQTDRQRVRQSVSCLFVHSIIQQRTRVIDSFLQLLLHAFTHLISAKPCILPISPYGCIVATPRSYFRIFRPVLRNYREEPPAVAVPRPEAVAVALEAAASKRLQQRMRNFGRHQPPLATQCRLWHMGCFRKSLQFSTSVFFAFWLKNSHNIFSSST